ncbi:MAG: exo-beta-N-acetylmuramidase NamZ domain-containing protein [Bacteroidia bacterium]
MKKGRFISGIRLLISAVLLACMNSCISDAQPGGILAWTHASKTDADIKTGASRLDQYLPLLKGKQVAFVGNHTSRIGKQHLLDSLIYLGIKVRILFSPEHGFRGKEDAGQDVNNSRDKKTGLTIISLYGNHKQPSAADLEGADIVLFDLQDVGARFYTYLSTLHYVMKACAENHKPLLLLDRPNPNGFYIDGPVMEDKYRSFVGLHPVPIVYGMTIGEYAQMVNEEGWLGAGLKCDLTIVKLQGYSHSDLYQLPVPPSPNLGSMPAVYLYPSLCLFEGTVISVGRGTDHPFEVIGHPKLKGGTTSFTPHSKPGATNPLYNGKKCVGYDFGEYGREGIFDYKKLKLDWLALCYKNYPDKAKFFNSYFTALCGTNSLEEAVKLGKSEEEIRAGWEDGLKKFRLIRKKYLLYTDFPE